MRDIQDGGPRRGPMGTMRISLLGRPGVFFEGRSLRFRTKKSLALLCYLAAEGGSHPRRELAELLWPRSDGRHARGDLRSALANLRKTLREGRTHDDDEDHLLLDGDLLGVASRGIDLD